VFFGLSLPRTYIFGAQTLPHRHEALLRAGRVPVAVVPDAGHGMTGENPAGFAQAVAEALP
jgi:pimeloyl-ACP methyl ester carboxylesterase